MQGDDPEMLKVLEGKLVALVRCVLNKAKADPLFAEELQEILISDSLRAKIKEKRPSVGRPGFNPVAFLQAHGREDLHRDLEGRPTSELSDLIRTHRIAKGKPAKALERPAMIDAIITYSERSLNQGGAFLRDRRGDEGSTKDESTRDSAKSSDPVELPVSKPESDQIETRIKATGADDEKTGSGE